MNKGKKLIRLAAIAAFLVPFFFAIKGTDWALHMDPDETTALHAMEDLIRDAHPDVRNYIYPEGFYVIANIYRKLSIPLIRLSEAAKQNGEMFRDLDAIRAPIRRIGAPSVYHGRRVNAILAGLCGLFLFLAVHVATGSIVGGLCASALAACSPFVVEHAHYCESDIAFCAGMTLAIWFLFTAIKRNSLRWTVAGAAASAGAFACKYTVAPIVPFCVAVYVAVCISLSKSAQTPNERSRALRCCAWAALLSIVAAFAAYAILTPLVIVDPQLYWSRIFNVWGTVHHETMARDISVQQDAVPFLRVRYILRHFIGELRSFGTVHIVLSALSAILLLARPRRNQCGVWLLVLTAMFFVFDLACAPWIRSQEFLPVAMLLCTVIALAVGELCVIASASGLRVLRFAVPVLCLAVCCLLAYGDASRVANMFSTEDCRNTARHWLEQSANPNTRFAAGRFASPSLRYGRINTADSFGEAEVLWGDSNTNAIDHEYFVRQTRFLGRGFVSNVTGERHPKFQSGWTNFLAHATLLREWKLLPGYQTTFSMLPLQLWGVIPEGAQTVLPTPLASRATAYRMGPEHYDAAQGCDWLGPIDAIRTVGARKFVRFVPPSDGQPLYAVTRHAEGLVPAKIKWEGCFEPREKVIAPGCADWFLYKPGLLDGWGDIYVRTRVRMRGDDQTSLCLTTITADPAYAAELLMRGGSPDKAAELLAFAKLPTDLGSAIDKSVAPIPNDFFTDFSRIRFGDFTVYPGPDSITNDLSACQAPVQVDLESEFPVLFDPGVYRVSFRVPRIEHGAPEVRSIFFSKAASQNIVSGTGFHPGETMEMEISFKKPTCPRICGTVIAKGKYAPSITLEDFTITWQPTSQSARR